MIGGLIFVCLNFLLTIIRKCDICSYKISVALIYMPQLDTILNNLSFTCEFPKKEQIGISGTEKV